MLSDLVSVNSEILLRKNILGSRSTPRGYEMMLAKKGRKFGGDINAMGKATAYYLYPTYKIC